MTIASELTTLNTTKTNIKAAIEAKGVTVGTVPFADYPSKIALISGGGAAPPTPEAWVRNPSWPQLSCVSGDNKATGLYAVWPNGSNFAAITAGTVSVGFTVNWGDGTTTDYANGTAAQYNFDYSNANLAGTDAPVTFTASTSTVNRTAHGYTNGMTVQFYNIVTTTGISEAQVYYVINATTDTFQISATSGGTAIVLTGDGSATLLPYKIAIITITPQSGVNITSLDLSIKHTQTNLQNTVSSGWLEFKVALANITSMIIGSGTTTGKTWHRMLENVELVQIGNITTFSNYFYNCTSLRSVAFPATLNVTSCQNTFYNCFNLTSVPLFDTSKVTIMNNMFTGCTSLITIPTFDTSSATSMNGMFTNCYSLFEIPELNTSNVTDMAGMFTACTTLVEIPLLDTSKVTTLSNTFNGCMSLKTIPLLNTSNVTNMSNMFADCRSLETIPLLNTSKVTNMSGMFTGCWSLNSVPLLDTALVTTMGSMFFNCYNLRSVPLFNTSNVTSTGASDMFRSCTSLETLPLIDLSKINNMSNFVRGCTNLKSIPDFNIPLVTSFTSAFQDCVNLREIPDLYTNGPTASSGYSSMFSGCLSLSRIKAKQFRWTFSVASCNLGPTELNEIYTNLPTVTGQTITVTGNWGTATDDPTIATAKGWTVTG